jgi:hypothetical protein
MRKLITYGTLIAGAVAAYMMYKRGESVGTIAKKATLNPIGSLISEMRA